MREFWVTWIDWSGKTCKELVVAATAVAAGTNWLFSHPGADSGMITAILLRVDVKTEGMGLPTGPPPS